MEAEEILLTGGEEEVAKRLNISKTAAAARIAKAAKHVLGERLVTPFTCEHLTRLDSVNYPRSSSCTFKPVQSTIIHPEKLSRPSYLSLGDGCLNSILGGLGVSTQHITEIHGPSSSGKTQLALQLLLCAQLPTERGGLASKGVVYLGTESKFPLSRFNQLVHHYHQTCDMTATTCYDQVHIMHIRDLATLEHIISYQLPALIKREGVRLVVLDSIAANFRGGGDQGLTEFDVFAGDLASPTFTPKSAKALAQSAYQRAHILGRIGAQFKRIAGLYDCAVVVINQVSDVFEQKLLVGVSNAHGNASIPPLVDWNTDKYSPCLGLIWSSIINTRIRMSREERGRRKLTLVFSPCWPSGTFCEFEITSSGIEGLLPAISNGDE